MKEYGVAIINDIAAGEMDHRMFQTVAIGSTLYNDAHAGNSPKYAERTVLR